MPDDFYCNEILTGSVVIDKVTETKNVLAYHHTNPRWPVHIVIIPKFHIDSFLQLIYEHRDVLPEIADVLAAVVDKIQREHGGGRLTTNFGKFQTTKHLHWHVYVGEDM